MAFNQPFDLYYWFVTTLSGNLTIFLGLAMLAIAGLGAMFRMPNMVLLASFALFAVILNAYVGVILTLVIVVGGLILYWGIARIFR